MSPSFPRVLNFLRPKFKMAAISRKIDDIFRTKYNFTPYFSLTTINFHIIYIHNILTQLQGRLRLLLFQIAAILELHDTIKVTIQNGRKCV